MDWKRMTIGKKIALGFGCILMLLSLVCVLSLTGVSGIVTNAGQVIEGNKLDSDLAQKEVDHLNWAGKVNAMLTDYKVTTLDVQTDHKSCKCGKWLYGEGRKHAGALVPSLAPLLKSLEEPHRILHESAIEIDRVFKQPHAGLNLTLSNRLTDHVNWVEHLGRAIASEAGGLYSYQNTLKVSVDQAMASIRNNDKDTEGDLKTRQNHVIHIIEELRYGNQDQGYFFILDEETKMVMHPMMPELEGKDVSETSDPSGKRLFSDMVRLCRENEEGFVVYQWQLPGSKRLAPKLTYVKQYQPWGWIVGSGIYLDYSNTALVKRAEDFAAGKPFHIGVQTDPERCAFGHFLSSPDTKALENTFPELKAALEAIIEPHNKLHRSAIGIEEMINNLDMQGAMRTLNIDTQEALAQVKIHFHKAIEAEQRLQEGLDKANNIYADKTTPALKEVQRILGEIRQETKRNIMTDAAMLEAARSTERSVTLISILAVIFGVLMAYFIARGIILVLKHIAMQMDQGSGQVASAAGQVSSASYQLAEGTSEQAASLEETSSSLEEISSMVSQNAKNAQQADDLMQEANQVVHTAIDAMGDLTASMQEISQASDETSKIIKTIDEIAFQTNLLALNAAVEAARAGEAGAGFAVVASEVRNLALRAAEAAKNTATLIEESVKKIANGSDIVTRTNDAFSHVADSSKKVGELVREISHASQEQSEGIGQINKAMLEMDKVTQQNAANAEESSSAAEQMNAQAQHMKMLSAELRALVDGTASHHESEGDASAPFPSSKTRPTEKLSQRRPEPIIPKALPMTDDFHDF